MDETNVVSMVFSDKNHLCSHNPLLVVLVLLNPKMSKHMFRRLMEQPMIFQRRGPKSASMPIEEEVIAFGGIAPTMARSSAHLQRKDNADDEVMDKARKLA
jgi:hypothetical protein